MVDFTNNQIDNHDKPLKGLQNEGSVNFYCADCGKYLLVLQLTTIDGDKDIDVLTRVVVFCCACGGFSHVKQIPGQFYPGAPSDDMIFDVSDDKTGAPETDVLFKAWAK